jgi:DNA-binding CsgD family transcriptional regulator
MLARVSALASLTERETQVCCLLLEGLKVPEVALRMGIKASTATTLKKRAFTRMGVRTKEELLRRLAT